MQRLTPERFYHPDRFAPDGSRILEFPDPEQAMRGSEWGRVTGPNFYTAPGRRLCYYLGAPEPSWLNFSPVLLFLSASRLARYRSDEEKWPVTPGCSYAIDSGAYIALTGKNRDVPWFLNADVYGGMITRFVLNNGWPPDFVAPQDWPCEPKVRAITGLTVRQHQELTLANYLHLVENFPFINWIPVLQGWEAEDYLVHERMYLDAGVDLAGAYRVGIGSICRRGHVPEIVEVLEQFAERGYRLHGFGIKTTALPIIGHLLASADSMAWSDTARKDRFRLPECEHTARDGSLNDCRNCFRWAVTWRERVLNTIRSTPQSEEVATVMAATQDKESTDETIVPPPGATFICPGAGCGRKATVTKAGKVGSHYKYGREKCRLAGKTPPAVKKSRVTLPAEQVMIAELADFFTAFMASADTAAAAAEPDVDEAEMVLATEAPVGAYGAIDGVSEIGVPLSVEGYVARTGEIVERDRPAEVAGRWVNIHITESAIFGRIQTSLLVPVGSLLRLMTPPEPGNGNGPVLYPEETDPDVALVGEAKDALLAVEKGDDITWAAGVAIVRYDGSLSGVMRNGWSERFMYGGYTGQVIHPAKEGSARQRYLYVKRDTGAVELHTEPYGNGVEPLARTSLAEIGALIGRLDPLLVAGVHAAHDEWQSAKDDYREAVGKAVAAKTATPDADRDSYRSRTEVAIAEGKRALAAAWLSLRPGPAVMARSAETHGADDDTIPLATAPVGIYGEATGITLDGQPITWQGFVQKVPSQWANQRPGMIVVDFSTVRPPAPSHSDIMAVQTDPDARLRVLVAPGLLKAAEGNPHVRGTVRMPYDAQGMGPAGSIVPAWVCCSCGGVEVTEFTLGLNHGCCTGAARTTCSLVTPKNHLNAHWRPPVEAGPEPVPAASGQREEFAAAAYASTPPKVMRNPYWPSVQWGWTCTGPDCRARAWANTGGSPTVAQARAKWFAHAATHDGMLPGWLDDLVPEESPQEQRRIEAALAKRAGLKVPGIAHIEISPEPTGEWWMDSAKRWRQAGQLVRQGNSVILVVLGGVGEGQRVAELLIEQGGVPVETMHLYEVSDPTEALESTWLNDDETLAELFAKVDTALNGHHGRTMAKDLAERYGNGLPLVRHNRKIGQEWTFICPVPECQGLYDGYETVRALRAAWFEHALAHAGFTPGWNDAEHPVEPEPEQVAEPVRKLPAAPKRPRHQVPTIMEIFGPPVDDPWWSETIADWEAHDEIARWSYASSEQWPNGVKTLKVRMAFNVAQTEAYAKVLCGITGLPEDRITVYRAAAAPERGLEFPDDTAAPAKKTAPAKTARSAKTAAPRKAEPKPVVDVQVPLFDLDMLDLDAFEAALAAAESQPQPAFDLDMVDLNAFDAALAAAEPAEVGWRDVLREASAVLETCTAQTPKTLVAWAAGAKQGMHAQNLVNWWRSGNAADLYGGIAGGGSLGGDRWDDHDRTKFQVFTRAREPIVKVTWKQVAPLVKKDKLPTDLVTRVEAAHAARRAWLKHPKELYHKPHTPEWVAANGQRREIEQECQNSAAAVWAYVKLLV